MHRLSTQADNNNDGNGTRSTARMSTCYARSTFFAVLSERFEERGTKNKCIFQRKPAMHAFTPPTSVHSMQVAVSTRHRRRRALCTCIQRRAVVIATACRQVIVHQIMVHWKCVGSSATKLCSHLPSIFATDRARRCFHSYCDRSGCQWTADLH